MQSRAAEPLFAEIGLTRADALKSIIFIEGDRFYQRSDAAIRIAQRLSWPFPVMGVFLAVPRLLRDAVYDCVGSNRYLLFGQSDTCLSPTTATLSRFLDAAEYKETQAAEARARREARRQREDAEASAAAVKKEA